MPKLPDGTITFLYSDIEGSTPLWDQIPRAMSVSQALHNKLLYQTIGEHQGQVFKVIGDAFQAVFVSPVNAVEAAIAIQHNLARADWGETGQVLVRIGLHVGTVKSEGNDYISSHTQNRVARIMSAGHGGQILLSLAVAELVHGNLPPEVQLQDLGEHYLKGISRPEHIFQVLAPGLQEKFPPLSTRIVPRGYTLLDQIGAGSFGGVYRALQPDVGREVAVKIILPQYANDPEFIRRFEFEAQTVARLEHPYIVPLYDYWREPDSAYLVMRLLRGGSLETLLQDGPLEPARALSIVDQIAPALHAAHQQGVIHRDLKPANILLDEAGNAYLSDFGIAMQLSEKGQQTFLAGLVGSPSHMSPEQLLKETVSPRSDIYSFGLLLYQILTGELPFPDDSFAALIDKQLHAPLPSLLTRCPELSDQVDEVIQRATDKDPEKRFPDALALAEAFRKALAGEYVLVPGLKRRESKGDELINPYKGLRAFQEADADDFYGREMLVAQLLESLAAGQDPNSRNGKSPAQGRFLVVVGPSGSGKSSVVKAGLIPKLRAGAIPGSQDWFITEILPGPHPFEELELALQRIAAVPAYGLMDHLRRDERGLSRAARLILPDENGELLLVIDQFEEIFTLVENKEETRNFLDSLYAAVTDPRSRVRVVVTLRGDFYDRPLMYPQVGELTREFTQVVLPLTVEELEGSIRKPAERVGIKLEEGLVTAIITDVLDQPGALPLLQYALTELYDHRQGKTLTLQAYNEIGGVLGALARRAEDEFAHLEAPEQEVARQIFLRLVTLGEGTEDTRRRVLRAELSALQPSGKAGEAHPVERVIEQFGRARLLSFDRDPLTRSPTVEVAHEALLREWHRLRQWLDESRADVRMQRILANLAADWMSSEHEASFLLRGSRLDQFTGWVENTQIALTGDESAFLQASKDAQAALQAEEAARKEREAVLERRSRTFLRAFVGVMAVATIVALYLSWYAFNQRDSARFAAAAEASARRLATSRELVRFAESELEELSDPSYSLALLLAREAVLATWQADAIVLPEAERILRETINTAPIVKVTLSGHSKGVKFAAWRPDGKMVVTAGLDNTARIWDSASGVELQRLEGHTSEVRTASWSPDGKRILTASRDRTIRIWDASSGEQVQQFPTKEAAYSGFWSPDGARIVVADGSYLQIMDADSGVVLSETRSRTGDYTFADWDPTGKKIAAAGSDHTVRIFDAASLEEKQILPGDAGSVNSVQWSHDSRYLLSAHDSNLARIWDMQDPSAFRDLAHTGSVQFAAWSSDDTRIASVTSAGDITLWDFRNGEVMRQWKSQNQIIWSVSWGQEDTQLLTAENDSSVHIWEARSLEELQRLPHNTDVMSVAWRPDNSQVITAGGLSLTAFIWDLQENTITQVLAGHDGSVDSVAWSPNGSRAATASQDGTVIIWDAQSGEKMMTIPTGHTSGVDSVSWNRSGELLLTVGRDRYARILQASSGNERLKVRAVTASWSPESTRIVTASSDGTVKILDALTGEELVTLKGHTDLVYTAVFSPDGKYVLTSSRDRTARIWDAQTGKALHKLEGHRAAVLAATWSPDGTQVATADEDGIVLSWNPQTGERLGEIAHHQGDVYSLAWSPDGTRLASASQDDSVLISPVGIVALLEQAEQLIRRNPAQFTEEERCAYLHDCSQE